MDKKFTKEFACQKHKGELIQRLSDSILSSSPLYCLECIVDNNRAGVYDNLLKFDEYIKLVCESPHVIESEEFKAEMPADISELLEKESAVIQQLTTHIEKEKQKVETFLNSLQEKALKVLADYKNAVFYSLDRQVETLKYNFGHIKGSAHKWYDNIPSQYYKNSEELEQAIQAQESSQTLEIFIKHLNRDLAEMSYLATQAGQENRELVYVQGREYIQTAAQELRTQTEILPVIRVGYELGNKVVLEQLERLLVDLLRDSLNLEHELQEIPPYIKHHDYSEQSSVLRTRKDKVLDTEMSTEKFTSKIQKLRSLLNETTSRISGSPKK